MHLKASMVNALDQTQCEHERLHDAETVEMGLEMLDKSFDELTLEVQSSQHHHE